MDTKQLTDARLMELADKGGESGRESLGTLFIRHNTALKIFLLARGHIGESDIEDIVQQTWTHLLEVLGVSKNSFDPRKGVFRPWLCAIGVNLSRNFHRYNKRIHRGGGIIHHHLHAIPKREGDEPMWDNKTRQQPYPHPLEIAIVNEQRRYVREAVRELPDKNRLAIEAVWLDGKTFRGFANESGIARRTLENRCMRAKKMMRGSLSQV